jgi:hypothetical protein
MALPTLTPEQRQAALAKALPGYGPAKAAAVLAQAGGLGEQQRRKLAQALGD